MIASVFDTNGFPPRWTCGIGWEQEPWIGWSHVFSDVATFAAYYAVPIVVAYFVLRKRDLKFPPIFWVFLGLIFFSCGTVHLIEAGMFWWPHYRLSALLKILTAVVSCAGVVVLVRSLPTALDLKSPAELALEVETRKAAEKKLALERHLLDTVLAHLPESVYIKDESGRYLRVSQTFSDFLGAASPGEIVGKSDFDFYSREEAERRRGEEAQVLRTEEPIINRIDQVTSTDGSRRWLSTTQIPLRLEDDELIGTFGISHDITEIREAQEQLDEVASGLALPREMDRQLAEAIPLQDFSLQHMINCGSRIRGLSQVCKSQQEFANDLVRFLYREHVDENGALALGLVRMFTTRRFSDLPAELQQIAKLSAGDTLLDVDTPCLTLLSTAGIEEDWNVVERSAGHRAIPLPSKEAVKRLPMVAQLIQQLGFDAEGIVRGTPNFVVDEMRTGVFHLPDAAGSEHIPAQDFVRQYGIKSVVGYGDILPSGEFFAVICFSRIPVLHETAVLFSHLSISTRLALLGYQSDEHTRIESRIKAVDQLLRNYESVVCEQERKLQLTMRDLERTRDAANEANRAKSEFLANMSHEIRTPMNAVIGMTELVLDSRLETSQRDYLETVLESGESLLSIINEILDFSKIESGVIELDQVSFDLRDTISDMVRSLAQRAHAKGLELACELQADLPYAVIGDAVRLRQIIVNLIGNAIKFTEEGEVVIGVRTVANSETHSEIEMTVSDTGIGIPADRIDSVFQAFEQADSSTTRRFGGTGLGLAICSSLVEAMGGRIDVHSEPGKGSRFQVRLNLEVSTELPKTPPNKLTDVEGLSILIVDDNATNRRILEQMLQNWGLCPLSAEDALGAIDLLKSRAAENHRIPIVVTDVHMPEIDGYELTRRIRDDDEIANTEVIVLTSGSRQGDLKLCEELQVAAHLMKPVKQSELLNAIMTAVGADNATPDEPRENEQTTTSPQQTLNILVAEDGQANQLLARALLQQLGHQVTIANNGREAVTLWESVAFDIILMDIQMPVLDGFEATREIRSKEDASARSIPIIALTAHAMKGDRERCLEAGMNNYVSKPIRKAELARVLGTVDASSALQPGTETNPVPGGPDTEAAIEDASDDPALSIDTTGADSVGPPSLQEQKKPLIDWDTAIRNMPGAEGLVRELAELFRSESPRLLAQMQDGYERQEAELVRRAAHTLKSSAAIFAATAVVETAERLESAAGDADLNNSKPVFEELAALTAQLIRELDDYLANR